MATRPGKIYRGSWGRRKIITAVAFILVLLLASLVIAFDSMQKYVVYEPDGLRVELPILATAKPDSGEAAAKPPASSVTADIVVSEPSFEDIVVTAGAELAPVYALSVSVEDLANGKLGDYANQMETRGANALIIEVKPENGRLVYASTAAGAIAFDTSGGFDLVGAVAGLKVRDVYLIARLSACVDGLMATRNSPIALLNENSEPWSDGDGRLWLDARNRNIRAYLTDLMTELADMGFDEILLSNVALPAVDIGASGPFPSNTGAVDTDAYTAVGNLAVNLSKVRDRAGVKVSVLMPAMPDARTGQSLELFLKVFDRVYCPTGAGTIEADRSAVESVLTDGSADLRFVQMMPTTPDGEGSWAIAPAS